MRMRWLCGRSLIAGAAVLVSLPAPVPAQDLEGCWVGTMAAGPNRRRAILDLQRQDGTWTGQFHALVSEVTSGNVGGVTLEDAQWTVTVPSMDGEPSFRGALSADGQAFSGDGLRAGVALPFQFRRITESRMPEAGYWRGALLQGGTPVLRINLNMVAAPCGQLLVMMDSPDQGSTDMPITGLEMRGDTLLFDMTYVGGSFEGLLSPDGTELTGTWRQGGSAVNMNLRLGDTPSEPLRPQEPKPPFPYSVEEVSYRNESAGITLAGTLTAPDTPGPHPAVILISGSGAQDRDESLMGHRPFLLIADYLTRRGVAVLRYDDRGVGGSGGDTFRATLQDNVTDVEAAITFLTTRPEIDADKIGLIGHSEGGWVAPLVATRSDEVAFIVMLAGPGVNAEDLLYAQQAALLGAAGAAQSYIDANAKISGLAFEIIKETGDTEIVRERLLQAIEDLKERSSAQERAGIEQVMAAIPEEQWQTQLSTMTTPWFRGLLSYDPTGALRDVDVPVLALIGELDLQVPPAQNIPALEQAFANGKASDYTVRELPRLNHLFQTATTGSIAEYVQIEETMSPTALEIISDWILARVGG